MKISTKGIYALEAMIELTLNSTDSYLSIREIAENRKCSTKYLEQIFKLLKENNLITSTRGKEGGYKLARPANTITAREIILAVEICLDPVLCISKSCPRERHCKTRPIWQGMQNEIFKVLDSKTLAELVQQVNEVKS